MKKINIIKILIILYFVVVIIAPILEEYEININPFDYAKITDLEYKAIVDDNPDVIYDDYDYQEVGGKIKVTEKVTFDVHAASSNNLFWELWRDLPEDTVDGAKVSYKVNSVKQILDDGSTIEYEEAPKVYYDDSDYVDSLYGLGPYKWFYSPGPYNEYRQQYEAVMIYIPGTYRQKMTFEIEYEMYNASLRYGDCSELYLSMFSENSVYGLKHFKGEILFPDDIMPEEGNYTVSTFGTNKGSFPVTKSTAKYPGYSTFTMELNESDLKFKPYNEYIEFSLVSFGKDKHSFTKYASQNDYYYTDVLDEINEENLYYQNIQKTYFNIKLIVLGICLLISICIVKKTNHNIKKQRETHTFYEPTIDALYYREIPSNIDPLFAAHLAFCKEKKTKEIEDGYAALLLSLARKKYIELKKVNPNFDWISANTKIIIKYKPSQEYHLENVNNFDTYASYYRSISSVSETAQTEEYEELTPNEKEYFNLILRHCTSDEINFSELERKISEDYDNTDNFVRNLENSKINIGINQGYYQKARYTEVRDTLNRYKKITIIFAIIFGIGVNIISYHTRLDFAFGGYFIIAIANLVSAFYYQRQSQNSLLLTQFGEDEYVKWKGLYEFLNSETLMSERTIIELPLWEQYLVYATAFGISEKVIQAIQLRCPEAYKSPILDNSSAYRSTHFYHSSRSIRTSSHHASSISRGGGHGGFGGYGGGGRGGGGGGGGH